MKFKYRIIYLNHILFANTGVELDILVEQIIELGTLITEIDIEVVRV